MKTGKTRRSRIIRLVLLIAVLVASQTISFETSSKLQTVNATVSSSAPFQYIVTILMENNGLCDVTPSLVSGCGSASNPARYITSLAQSYGFNTHYTGVGHPSEPNYVALLGGSTFGYTSDGYCCFQLNSPNLVDRLEAAGLSWKAFAEDSSGSGTCGFMPPRSGDHYPFIDFSDMKTSARCANMLTTTSPLDPEFLAAINGVTLPNYVWLTPNDSDNMHSSSITIGDSYLAALVPLILSSRMFTTQNAALFIVFDEGNDFCPTGNSKSDCVVAEWAGPAVKKAYSSTTSYNHYSYLSTLEANWNLASLTANDASAPPMTEFFGTSPPPTLSASFTYSPSSPQTGHTVSFSGSSSGGTSPYSYSWSFGDGSTGTGSSVTHSYSSAGSFTVTLTVKDSGSPQQTVTSQQTISVTSPPPALTASFTFSPSSPQTGQQVSFTGSASGGTSPYSYSWSFGDGSTGSGSSVTHTYSSAGTYTAVLTVKDSGSPQQTATSQQPITVTSPPPALTASFTYNPSSPQVGQTVSFSGSASGGVSPYSYSWSFGDGSTGSGSSVTHAYASTGSFTVVLTVRDTGSPQQTTTSQQSITVSGAPPPLSASFAYSPSSSQAGQPVTFTTSASGGTSPFTFSWSFGDGLAGTGSPVTHTYSLAGSYTTTLTIKDSSSPQQTATSQKTVAVTSPPPPISASFTLSPSSPSGGQSVSFTASASGGTPPYSYSWSYGDGSTGTGLQSTHIYSVDGTYQVTLTVEDSQGNTGTGVEPAVVGTSPLLDGFTFSPTGPQPGENINFTASARGGTPPYSYSWDFGNGASVTGASATHSYPKAGSYTVTLTVMDSTNHSNNTSQDLTIYSPAQPDFKLNTDQLTLNAQPGSEQSLAITVTDIAGPSGTIRFNATISPSGPRISLDPANVTLASEGSGSTSLIIDVSFTTAPGPYWIQVKATNGSITHSITVQVDVAQHSQIPTTSPPCRFCLGSAAIIGVLGLVGAVTLVTVGARRRQRLPAVRDGKGEEASASRVCRHIRRPLQ